MPDVNGHGRAARTRLACAVLAILTGLISALSSCGAPAEESAPSDTPAETVIACAGVSVTVPLRMEADGDGYVSEDGTLRIWTTRSSDAFEDMSRVRIQKSTLLKTISGYTQSDSAELPYAAYCFAGASGVPCAQILAEPLSGGTVCFTAEGIPEDGEGWIASVLQTLKRQEETMRLESSPSPASMHSDGISPITGTFIQSWLYVNYSEERWDREFRLMREMGIEYVIMGDTATIRTGTPITDETQYEVTAYYPTANPAFRAGSDCMTVLFEHCRKYGMKLYVGMGNTSVGWPYLDRETVGLRQVASVFADIAEDLYRVYYERFPETFAGFYFVPELYNSSAFDTPAGRDAYVRNLAEGFGPVFDRIHSLGSLPFIFSPYVNMFGGDWVSKNPDNIAEFWKQFLRDADFRDGDILCPQDSVGAGGNDLNGLDAVTKAYRTAVDGCGKKISLWTNAELFIQPTGKFFDNFDGYGGYWSSCTVDRMVRQFEIASRYVDRIFTFAVPHYLSPYNTTDGYYKTYLHYLETGELDDTPPQGPTSFRTGRIKVNGKDALQIAWGGMYDEFGIHRVNIYRNGEFWNYRNCTRNEGSEQTAEYPNVFNDTEFDFTDPEDGPVVYAFEAVDCAGNVGERVELTVTPSSVPNGVRPEDVYRGADAVTEGLRRLKK